MTNDEAQQEHAPPETLDQYLTRLIAAQEGIPPNQVTLEYIRNQREQRFYPDTRYDICSNYGGYRNDGLETLTRNEVVQLEDKVNQWLEQESARSKS